MKSKVDFLDLPMDARLLIYAKLPLSSFARLFTVSKLVKKDFFLTLFDKSNQIVLDYIHSDNRTQKEKEFFKRSYFPSWSQNSPIFQQFIYENNSQFDIYSFSLGEEFHDPNEVSIYLEIKNNELHCSTKNGFFQKLEIKIQDPCFKDSTLTHELVKPFENKIKKELGASSVNAFLANLDLWIGLFKHGTFQSCYANGQINYISCGYFADNVHKLWEATGYIKGSCLHLSDYVRYYNRTSILDWLKKHPNEINRSRQFDIRNKDYSALIQQNVVSIEECLKFGEVLLELNIPEAHEEWLYIHVKHRIIMELFCEGLSADPSQFIKGKAVLALLNYKDERRKDYSEEPLKKSTHHAVYNFFKKPFSLDYDSKVNAAENLVYVLCGKRGYSLSFGDKMALTWGMGAEKEDRLPKIVRTMILEPLALESLEGLNQSLFKSVDSYGSGF